MSCTIIVQSEEAKDRAATLRNRAGHGVNKNFLFWYRELYPDQLRDFSKLEPLSRVFRFGPFSASSYMATGGISRRLQVPAFSYHTLFSPDLAIRGRHPRFCAAFSP